MWRAMSATTASSELKGRALARSSESLRASPASSATTKPRWLLTLARARIMTGMSRRSWAVLVALIVILALAARLIPGPRTIDDAYITFRYARNLLAGNGFVFNPGERVLGTTTPLYTLLLAALAGLTRATDYPRL